MTDNSPKTDSVKKESFTTDLAAAAGVGVWSRSRSTDFKGSPTFFDLLGIANAPSLGLESFLELVHRDDRDAVRTGIEESFGGDGRLTLDFRLLASPTAAQWRALRGGPTGSGELGGVLLEISALRQLNQQLQARLSNEGQLREAAEAANRLKDEFVALVAHELRSPLNAMLGWARILQSKQVDEATLKRAIETIERSARAQSKLIEDLIDAVRISTGKLSLEAHPVDLKKVVAAAVDIARLAAEAKQVSIEVKLDDAPLEVLGDADRLRQVVGNLLSNAVKFTPGGGKIEVAVEKVESDARVTVRDSGLGINSELLPRIFDRFDQAGHSNTRRHGGLGLGLSLVRQLVDLHGGSVRAESAGEGKGATFIVQLRLRPCGSRPVIAVSLEPVQAASGRLNLPSIPLNGISILVVDDDPDARELTSMLLRKNGATVRAAASAAEAFSALSTSADFLPNLLLSDIGMPDEDGYSLIARVRALTLPNVASVPAIALTAFGSAEDRERAFASGFDAHLTKPIEPSQLVGEIARLAARVTTTSTDAA